MILDSSALVAIFRLEAEAASFTKLILEAELVRIAAPTYLETQMVLLGKKASARPERLADFLEASSISVMPLTHEMASVAISAFMKYGKGRGHAAQLNFGDCISYAMIKTELMPLLFKGDDFRYTDVEAAV
jgi:ribonuclease VapC